MFTSITRATSELRHDPNRTQPEAPTRRRVGMSLNRYAVRRDANEGEIVAALERIGCTVARADIVDLIVGYRGRSILLELKDGSKPPSARKLTPNQLKLVANWRGQYDVVTSVDEAIAIVQRHTLGKPYDSP